MAAIRKIIILAFFLLFSPLFAVASETENATEKELTAKLSAATGELTIADTIGNEEIARRIILAWAKINKNINISLSKVSLADVIEKRNSAGYNIVLYQHNPAARYNITPEGNKEPYAIEAALVFVATTNPVEDISLENLCRIFDGRIDTWELIDNRKNSLRRYGVAYPLPGERAMRLAGLQESGFTDSLQFSGSQLELLTLCSSSNTAIGFGGYLSEVPDTVKTLKIDSVSPTLENISNGKYPLVLHRLSASDNSANAKLFLEILRSPQIRRRILAGNFALPDLSPKATPSTAPAAKEPTDSAVSANR